ncbi:MAG: hypothetical protein CMH83_03605 [Nocardioides sp.]|nr:hypothetical protein [Nocardioides sp.]
MPFAVFRGLVTDDWQLVVARDGDQPVALTMVTPRPGPGVAHEAKTFFTGVSPSHRGRGLAVAVKAAQALGMVERGITRLSTQNMDGNAPMLAANARLGFVRSATSCDVPVRLG